MKRLNLRRAILPLSFVAVLLGGWADAGLQAIRADRHQAGSVDRRQRRPCDEHAEVHRYHQRSEPGRGSRLDPAIPISSSASRGYSRLRCIQNGNQNLCDGHASPVAQRTIVFATPTSAFLVFFAVKVFRS